MLYIARIYFALLATFLVSSHAFASCQELLDFRASTPAVIRSLLELEIESPSQFIETLKRDLDPKSGRGFAILDTRPWFTSPSWLPFQKSLRAYSEKEDSLDLPGGKLRSSTRRTELSYTYTDGEASPSSNNPSELHPFDSPPEEASKVMNIYIRWLNRLLKSSLPNEHRGFSEYQSFIRMLNLTPLGPASRFWRRINRSLHVDPNFLTVVTPLSTAGTQIKLASGEYIEVPIGATLILSGSIRGVYHGEKANLRQKTMTWHRAPATDQFRMVLITRVFFNGYREKDFIPLTTKSLIFNIFDRVKRKPKITLDTE